MIGSVQAAMINTEVVIPRKEPLVKSLNAKRKGMIIESKAMASKWYCCFSNSFESTKLSLDISLSFFGLYIIFSCQKVQWTCEYNLE
jgi:hypothetical protein